MNDRQRTILSIGLAVVATMVVVPPWEHSWQVLDAKFREPLGYHFLWAPPTRYEGSASVQMAVDLRRLGLQSVSVAAVVAALMLSAGGPGKDGEA